MSDGGFDSVALKDGFVCFAVFVRADAIGESSDDEGLLVGLEGVQEWVIRDPALV